MILVFLFSDTALAAVSADVLTAAGEFVDGQTAAVRTAFLFTCKYYFYLNLGIFK